jgi:sugar phosphate permease
MQRSWFRRRYRWLISAFFALVTFIGSLTGNLTTSGMDDFVRTYRPWLWAVTVLAGLTAVAMAIWDARQPDERPIQFGLRQIDTHKALTSRFTHDRTLVL